jgi:hypothetical protein
LARAGWSDSLGVENFTISGFLGFIRLAKQEDVDRLAQGLSRAGLPD